MHEREKLPHLLEHWAEHSEEHAASCLKWAEKADAWGKGDLAALFREIAEENGKITKLFEKARGMV